MYRSAVILLMLAGGGLLAGSGPTANDSDASKVAERVKAHINERMSETCRSVTLKHEADAVYRGYAEFLNGARVDLEVSVSGSGVEYRFLKRPPSEVPATETRLAELEALVAQQKAEIVRLRELCLRAQIDVDPPQKPEAAVARSEDANSIAVESARDASETVYEDREMAIEENPRFTWRVYESIQKGMSYTETVDILHDEGDLISSSYFDNAENEVIVWTNPDDSHICVVFRNRMVLVKTQFGLPESAAELPH